MAKKPIWNDHERDLLIKMFRVLGAGNAHEREIARRKIDSLLRKHQKVWADLADLLNFGFGQSAAGNDLARLLAALGSNDAKKRQDAFGKITDVLARQRKNWNDLAEWLCSPSSPSWADDFGQLRRKPASPKLLEFVRRLLAEYVALKPHEYTAVALWVLHTHVFGRFMITPRLFLTSPVRGCGKTLLKDIIAKLVAKPETADAISASAIYNMVDDERPTVLIDEGDNLGVAQSSSGRWRAVFNSGHRRGGSITLMNRGGPRKYQTFSPLLLAAIGSMPLPMMHRSIVIAMERHDGQQELKRFDGEDRALDHFYQEILQWAIGVELDTNPEMPAQLRNRQADNWRPLLAIADSFGWGAQAREAAIWFAKGYQDEDAEVLLLRDIRTVFDTRGMDRLSSAALVAGLIEDDDAQWSEWRGLRGDQQPRRLSQGELARMLGPFRIRPRTIWPPNRTAGDKSAKGYFRAQFEAAWRAYCGDGTTAQSSNVRRLRSV